MLMNLLNMLIPQRNNTHKKIFIKHTMSIELKKQLSSTFTGELIIERDKLAEYANDASIFAITPLLVARPKNVSDIKNLVLAIKNLRKKHPLLSITARAAGTGMAGGALTESVVLDIKTLNNIKKVTEDFAILEPGVYFRDFEKATLAINRIMPSFPASKNLCATGGMVNTNASGERTLRYGSTEHYVENLKLVLSDGNEYSFGPLSKKELDEKMSLKTFEGDLYRKVYNLVEENYDAIKKAKPKVSKNSTGYALWNVWDRNIFDMTKLFVGSEGTLGITTEIKFGLVEPEPISKLLVIFVNDLTVLPKLVAAILKHKPASFESYDDNTFKFAVRFLPDLVKSLKAKGFFSLLVRFIPEFLMILKGGVPKLVLLAEFTGTDKNIVVERTEQAQKSIASFGLKSNIASSKEEMEKYWTIRHESFNLLRHHGGKKHTAPFIDDIIVSPENLPEFLPRLNTLMREYNLTYTVAGHIGEGNLHIIPLMDLHKKREREIIFELAQKVFDLTFEFNGSMSGEHNDGLIRTPFLKQMYGDKIYHLFEEVKIIFDPENIFNPGKKVFANDISYVKDHIDKVY